MITSKRLVAHVFIVLGLLIPHLAKAQFFYTINTTPESADVYLNGVHQGKTPARVRLDWNQKPDSGYVFKIEYPGYVTEEFVLNEKPRVIKTTKSFALERSRPHFDLDSASASVEFDKLLVEFQEGHVIGEASSYNRKESIRWEGFSRQGGDPIILKTYDVLGSAGFNTPMRQANQLFSDEKKASKNARFVLAGKLKEIWITVNQTTGYANFVYDAKLTIEWQVLDRKTGQVVSKMTTSGRDNGKTSVNSEKEYISAAYAEALYLYLASRELYDLVKNAGNNVAADLEKREEKTVEKTFTFAKVALSAYPSSSEMIQQSTQSCLTIVTDAGHGSGFLISESGYLMTAAHVVADAHRISVTLPSGIELEPELIAIDRDYDVALLKMPGSKYKPMSLGTGMAVGLGEEVFTIGTPGDVELGQSVAKGILSGKRKQEDIIYLQTDLSVSPGNSGGPLLNSKGEVVGVVEKKLMGSGIEGIGFALPIETAMKVLGITIE